MGMFLGVKKMRWAKLTLAALIFAFVAGIVSVRILAVDDHTPPQVTAFSFSPTTVDTDAASQDITVTMTITDAQSGARDSGEIIIKPRSGTTQMGDVIFHRTAGDEHSGTYTGVITLPQSSATGVWDVDQLSIFDTIGNSTTLHKAELEAAFGAGVASVTNTASTEDVTPPEVTAFNLSSSSINTENLDQEVTATFSLTDAQTGARDSILMYMTPATGSQMVSATAHRVSGTANNGNYSATLTFPKGSAGGVWSVSALNLFDTISNGVTLYKADLETLFGSGVASVTNTAASADITPPQITAFSLSPTEFNTETQSQNVSLSLTITDTQTGVRSYGELTIVPLVGTQMGDVIFNRTSGDEHNGTYTGTISLPAGSKEGVWEVGTLCVFDNINNSTCLTAETLHALLPNAQGVNMVNTAESQSVTIDRQWTLTSDSSRVVFPANTVVTRKEGGKFAFYKMLAVPYDVTTRTSNGRRTGVVGTIRTGVPGLDLTFSQPVSISLAVDSSLNGKRLRIQSLDENGTRWSDETQCLVAGGYCTFTVTHATYFLATTDTTGLLPNELPNTGAHAE